MSLPGAWPVTSSRAVVTTPLGCRDTHVSADLSEHGLVTFCMGRTCASALGIGGWWGAVPQGITCPQTQWSSLALLALKLEVISMSIPQASWAWDGALWNGAAGHRRRACHGKVDELCKVQGNSVTPGCHSKEQALGYLCISGDAALAPLARILSISPGSPGPPSAACLQNCLLCMFP